MGPGDSLRQPRFLQRFLKVRGKQKAGRGCCVARVRVLIANGSIRAAVIGSSGERKQGEICHVARPFLLPDKVRRIKLVDGRATNILRGRGHMKRKFRLASTELLWKVDKTNKRRKVI